jgi:hypothetical protein
VQQLAVRQQLVAARPAEVAPDPLPAAALQPSPVALALLASVVLAYSPDNRCKTVEHLFRTSDRSR